MISIILPVYNTSKYLDACIYSICNQTYSNIEIICVNDGSTDDSGEILEKWRSLDARIRVIQQENKGVSAARNRGLQHATGDLIYFPDSDDILAPTILDTLCAQLEKYKADISMCGYRKYYLDGTWRDILGTDDEYIETCEEACGNLIRGERYTGSLCTKLFRKEILQDIQFDETLKINEDILFCYHAFSKAKRLVFLDRPLYYYYERSVASSSRNSSMKKMEDVLSVSEKIFKDCHVSSLRNDAAEKLYKAAVRAYRTYLMECDVDWEKQKNKFVRLICEAKPLCTKMRRRYKLDYVMMRGFPHFYRILYRLYDRIRTPNWDL